MSVTCLGRCFGLDQARRSPERGGNVGVQDPGRAPEAVAASPAVDSRTAGERYPAPAPSATPAAAATSAQPPVSPEVAARPGSASGCTRQKSGSGGLGSVTAAALAAGPGTGAAGSAAGTSTNTATTSTAARVLAAASGVSADTLAGQGHVPGPPQGQGHGTETDTDRSRSASTSVRAASQRRQGDELDPRIRISFHEITFYKVIGKGSFKTVYRGAWNNTHVAVVAMRRGGLVAEARLLQRLSTHPNLVQLYRWSADESGNEYLVMELLPLGSLDAVLRSIGRQLLTQTKMTVVEQLASACLELAHEGLVHGDLAARNLLVKSLEPPHVKLADFGLSRPAALPGQGPGDGPASLDAPPAATPQSVVPARWAAPEVLAGEPPSEAADVWSFGVVCWEIFANAAEPYSSLSTSEILNALRSGQRLERPRGCPLELWALVQTCWRDDPRERPSFATITNTLRTWREAYVSSRVAARGGPAAASLGNPGSVAAPGPAASPAASVTPGSRAGATGLGRRGDAPAPNAAEPVSPGSAAAAAAAKAAAARVLLHTAAALPDASGDVIPSRSQEPLAAAMGLATGASGPPGVASYPAASPATRVASEVLGAHAPGGFPSRSADPPVSGSNGTGDGMGMGIVSGTGRNTSTIASGLMQTHMSFEVGEPPILPAYTSGSSAALTSAVMSRASRELHSGAGYTGGHPAALAAAALAATSGAAGQGVPVPVPQPPGSPHRTSPSFGGMRVSGGLMAATKRMGVSTGQFHALGAAGGVSNGVSASVSGRMLARFGRRTVRKTHSATVMAAPLAAAATVGPAGAAGASAGAASVGTLTSEGTPSGGGGALPGRRMAASMEEVQARLSRSSQPLGGAQAAGRQPLTPAGALGSAPVPYSPREGLPPEGLPAEVAARWLPAATSPEASPPAVGPTPPQAGVAGGAAARPGSGHREAAPAAGAHGHSSEAALAGVPEEEEPGPGPPQPQTPEVAGAPSATPELGKPRQREGPAPPARSELPATPDLPAHAAPAAQPQVAQPAARLPAQLPTNVSARAAGPALAAASSSPYVRISEIATGLSPVAEAALAALRNPGGKGRVAAAAGLTSATSPMAPVSTGAASRWLASTTASTSSTSPPAAALPAPATLAAAPTGAAAPATADGDAAGGPVTAAAISGTVIAAAADLAAVFKAAEPPAAPSGRDQLLLQVPSGVHTSSLPSEDLSLRVMMKLPSSAVPQHLPSQLGNSSSSQQAANAAAAMNDHTGSSDGRSSIAFRVAAPYGNSGSGRAAAAAAILAAAVASANLPSSGNPGTSAAGALTSAASCGTGTGAATATAARSGGASGSAAAASLIHHVLLGTADLSGFDVGAFLHDTMLSASGVPAGAASASASAMMSSGTPLAAGALPLSGGGLSRTVSTIAGGVGGAGTAPPSLSLVAGPLPGPQDSARRQVAPQQDYTDAASGPSTGEPGATLPLAEGAAPPSSQLDAEARARQAASPASGTTGAVDKCDADAGSLPAGAMVTGDGLVRSPFSSRERHLHVLQASYRQPSPQPQPQEQPQEQPPRPPEEIQNLPPLDLQPPALQLTLQHQPLSLLLPLQPRRARRGSGSSRSSRSSTHMHHPQPRCGSRCQPHPLQQQQQQQQQPPSFELHPAHQQQPQQQQAIHSQPQPGAQGISGSSSYLRQAASQTGSLLSSRGLESTAVSGAHLRTASPVLGVAPGGPGPEPSPPGSAHSGRTTRSLHSARWSTRSGNALRSGQGGLAAGSGAGSGSTPLENSAQALTAAAASASATGLAAASNRSPSGGTDRGRTTPDCGGQAGILSTGGNDSGASALLGSMRGIEALFPQSQMLDIAPDAHGARGGGTAGLSGGGRGAAGAGVVGAGATGGAGYRPLGGTSESQTLLTLQAAAGEQLMLLRGSTDVDQRPTAFLFAADGGSSSGAAAAASGGGPSFVSLPMPPHSPLNRRSTGLGLVTGGLLPGRPGTILEDYPLGAPAPPAGGSRRHHDADPTPGPSSPTGAAAARGAMLRAEVMVAQLQPESNSNTLDSSVALSSNTGLGPGSAAPPASLRALHGILPGHAQDLQVQMQSRAADAAESSSHAVAAAEASRRRSRERDRERVSGGGSRRRGGGSTGGGGGSIALQQLQQLQQQSQVAGGRRLPMMRGGAVDELGGSFQSLLLGSSEPHMSYVSSTDRTTPSYGTGGAAPPGVAAVAQALVWSSTATAVTGATGGTGGTGGTGLAAHVESSEAGQARSARSAPPPEGSGGLDSSLEALPGELEERTAIFRFTQTRLLQDLGRERDCMQGQHLHVPEERCKHQQHVDKVTPMPRSWDTGSANFKKTVASQVTCRKCKKTTTHSFSKEAVVVHVLE
ncbi:hypothetical protein HYH02_002399 [Chlamydomonas schloesseri]|uniref:Protein kinase domain-containing protein n=1 Tax=Chlamydomonas schloesseri TaxID=2026947 RepID=A0A836BAX8_9CHLO|nr:hypothetical protein HYH02_002399 [Chlamydomonas schloesseri]|eukprot:KAG2453066.1 hypothetical protein HYH02_002399 [Chlamydomonas schloesseri]